MENHNLNQPQFEAVQHTQGPLLVLAGAGTGKTKVLTSRIIHIVNSYLASPLQILAVTFTNKAAAEMKHRIGAMIGEQVNNLWIGTFHSLAAKILRRHAEFVGLKSDFTIIDEDDQNRLLKQILTDLNIDSKQFAPKNYLNKISRLKDQALSKPNDDDLSLPKFVTVYENYQSRLKSMNAVDFGDLLLYNLEIFAANSDLLAYYQDKFRYILVDEYQDTNNSQYRWLLYLSAKNQNICCVGDDDQSIYSWRGANIANILRFEKDFKDAKVIRLEQNYRSTPNILKAASAVIAQNKERHGKTLWTEEKNGEKIRILSFLDDRSESATIANMIANSHFPKAKTAVLVRAGYQTRSFEEAFIHNSLPYKVVGGMKFYERMEIRDCLAYLRLCANFSDDLAFNRIANVPKRGIGEASIASIYEKSRQNQTPFLLTIKNSLDDSSLRLSGKVKEALQNLSNQLQKWQEQINQQSLSDIARGLLEDVGYLSMWRTDSSIEAQGRLENIEEFINSLADFSNITEFLEYVSLIEAREDKNITDAVTIMTIHAAKGLEFDLVFLPGLEDGIFPSAKSFDTKNGIEEERRLMYVAITRARKSLVMSFAKTRYVYGDYQAQMPSRFLKELPQDEILFEEIYSGGFAGNFSSGFAKNSFAKQPNFGQIKTNSEPEKSSYKSSDLIFGKRVFHQKFGYGKIENIDGNKLEINFEKTGKKVVMKEFLQFD